MFSKGNLTLVFKGLERAGLVQRRRLEDDHRFVEVQITAAERSLSSQLLPLHTRAVRDCFVVLTTAEQEHLSQTCQS